MKKDGEKMYFPSIDFLSAVNRRLLSRTGAASVPMKSLKSFYLVFLLTASFDLQTHKVKGIEGPTGAIMVTSKNQPSPFGAHLSQKAPLVPMERLSPPLASQCESRGGREADGRRCSAG